jgi:hypothetical protein
VNLFKSAKERITEQLNLLQARGLVKKDASNANLKKVKKAPMKKAQKVKKMKVMDRARIIAEKVRYSVNRRRTIMVNDLPSIAHTQFLCLSCLGGATNCKTGAKD